MKAAGQVGRVKTAPAPRLVQTSQQVQNIQKEYQALRGRLLSEARKPGALKTTTKTYALKGGATISEYLISASQFSARELQQLNAFGFKVKNGRVALYKHSDGRISNEKRDLVFMGAGAANHPLNRLARLMPRDAQRAFRRIFKRGFFTINAIRRSAVNMRHLVVKMATRGMRNPTPTEYALLKNGGALIAKALSRGVSQEQAMALLSALSGLKRSQIWVRG